MSAIKYQTFSLSKARDLVKYGWYMAAEEAHVQTYPDLLIPDACPEFIFVLEGAYEKLALQAPHSLQVIAASNLVGLSTESFLIRRRGRIRLLGLKLTPLGFYQLFPDQVGHYLNQNTLLGNQTGDWLEALDIQLRSIPKLANQQEVLAKALIQQAQSYHKTKAFHVTQDLITDILASKGDIQIKTLAQQQHKSIRQIQRYFKQFVGISPKQFAQLIRFKAFYKENYLQSSANSFWDYGYYDQNHFIQDFKAKLGALPSESNASHFRQKHWIARESLR